MTKVPATLEAAVAASSLVNGSVQAALVSLLVRKGIISSSDARDVYEQALLLIEEQQGAAVYSTDVFEAARGLIEPHLQPKRT